MPHSRSKPDSLSASLGGLCAFAVHSSFSANFTWVRHMLHHLAPNGAMALLLDNGSMSSNSSRESDIRLALIEADLFDCMVTLPGQLFTNTHIPACIWLLTKNTGFDEKMTRLSSDLKSQFAESAKLETAIKDNLKGPGYEL